MSETLNYHAPLAIYFEPRMLSELISSNDYLLFHISHQPTALAKTGLDKWLAKTPLGDDSPLAMDIDISCGLYDDGGELLDVLWYGKLRSAQELVRHHGDTFVGMNKNYRPNLVEERLLLRIWQLDERIKRVALFVHSHHLQPLNQAVDGYIYLSNNKNDSLHKTPFAGFDDEVTGVCTWQFVKMKDGDWRMSAPMMPINAKNSGAIAEKWQGIRV